MFGFDKMKILPNDLSEALSMLLYMVGDELKCHECETELGLGEIHPLPIDLDEWDDSTPELEKLKIEYMENYIEMRDERYKMLYDYLRSIDRDIIRLDHLDPEYIDYMLVFSNDTYLMSVTPVIFEIISDNKIRVNIEEFHYGYHKDICNSTDAVVSLLTMEKMRHYMRFKLTCQECGHEWYTEYKLDPRYHDYSNFKDINIFPVLNLFAKKFNQEEG